MTTFGAMANYSCNEGYNLMGPTARVCQPNGNWTEDAPVCQSKLLLHVHVTMAVTVGFDSHVGYFSCRLFEPHFSEQWSGIPDHNHL